MSHVLLIALLSAAPTADAVRVAAEPAHCLLGRDHAVQITVHTPPEATAVMLSANAGSLSVAARSDAGVYSATYTPPQEPYPRNVLIGAVVEVGDTEQVGWLLLPLWGQGRAEATTRAFGNAEVRIGDRTFGPVRADERGVASIEIEAPPGVHFADDGHRRIDLGIPETSNTHVFAGLRPLAADVASRVPVWVVSVSPTGTPLQASPPAMTSSRGRLSEPVELEPGLYHAILSLEPGEAGAVVVTATQASQSSLPARLGIDVPPGAPAHAVIDLEPKRVVAGSTTAVSITGRIADAVGNPIAQPVELTADLGQLEPEVHPKPGVVDAVLHLPPYFEGRDAVEIRLRSVGTSVGATARLVLQPASATALRLLAPREPVDASGEARPIRVHVVDAFGNAAPIREPPRLQAREGAVGAVRKEGAGSFVVDYFPPRRLTPGSDVIDAHAADLPDATMTLRLAPGASRVDVGAGVGLLRSSHARLAPSVSVVGSTWYTVGRFDLGARLDVSYAHAQEKARVGGMGAKSRQELTSAVVGVGARLPITSELSVQAQAGVGGCWLSNKLVVDGSDYPAEDALLMTARAAAAAGLRFGPGEVTLTVAYRWLAAPHLSSAAGTLHAVVTSFGYQVALR